MASSSLSLMRRRVFNTVMAGRARHGSRGWDWYYKALEKEKEIPAAPHVLHYKPLKPGHVRPRAFLELATAEEPLGRVVIELADDIVPRTVENFTKLCEGTAPSGFSYKGTRILSVIPNHVVAAGDVTNSKSGDDGHAAEDRYFPDENFVLGHPERGIVSMNNNGVDTNNSQFFITLAPAPHLDGRRVSFGRVVEGQEVLDALEGTFTLNFKPADDITIVDAGLVL